MYFIHFTYSTEAARAAVAKYWAGDSVSAEDVCLASGCSHALQIALSALCDAGTNVLLPRPGFSVYQTICEFIGVDWYFFLFESCILCLKLFSLILFFKKIYFLLIFFLLFLDSKYYDLDPKNQWEVNLESLEAAIDDKTRAILINNPSNPWYV